MNINIKINPKTKRIEEIHNFVKENKLKIDTKYSFPYMLPCTVKHNIEVDAYYSKIKQQLPIGMNIVKNAINNIRKRGINNPEEIISKLPEELYLMQYLEGISNPKKYKIDY